MKNQHMEDHVSKGKARSPMGKTEEGAAKGDSRSSPKDSITMSAKALAQMGSKVLAQISPTEIAWTAAGTSGLALAGVGTSLLLFAKKRSAVLAWSLTGSGLGLAIGSGVALWMAVKARRSDSRAPTAHANGAVVDEASSSASLHGAAA